MVLKIIYGIDSKLYVHACTTTCYCLCSVADEPIDLDLSEVPFHDKKQFDCQEIQHVDLKKRVGNEGSLVQELVSSEKSISKPEDWFNDVSKWLHCKKVRTLLDLLVCWFVSYTTDYLYNTNSFWL